MGAQKVFTEVVLKQDTEETGRKPLRFIKPKELSASNTRGLILEGLYIGPVPSGIDPSKNDFKFETDTEVLIVNSTGMLAKKMAQVPENTLVQVYYEGQEPIKSGRMVGKLAHCFNVSIAAE